MPATWQTNLLPSSTGKLFHLAHCILRNSLVKLRKQVNNRHPLVKNVARAAGSELLLKLYLQLCWRWSSFSFCAPKPVLSSLLLYLQIQIVLGAGCISMIPIFTLIMPILTCPMLPNRKRERIMKPGLSVMMVQRSVTSGILNLARLALDAW